MAEEATPTPAPEDVTEAPAAAAPETEAPEELDPPDLSEGDETKDEPAADAEEPDADASEDEESDSDPKERNRRGFAERTRIKSAVTSAIDQVAPEITEAELVDQGMDPAMAGIEALKARMERQEAINHVTEINAGLQGDAAQTLRDFPILDPASKSYDEGFATEMEQMYRTVANLQTSADGKFVVRADVPLYEFYSWAMRLRGSAEKSGTTKGQKAAEEMLTNSEPSSSAAPAKSAEEDDPFLKGLLGK